MSALVNCSANDRPAAPSSAVAASDSDSASILPNAITLAVLPVTLAPCATVVLAVTWALAIASAAEIGSRSASPSAVIPAVAWAVEISTAAAPAVTDALVPSMIVALAVALAKPAATSKPRAVPVALECAVA